jgi:hypothetical protein
VPPFPPFPPLPPFPPCRRHCITTTIAAAFPPTTVSARLRHPRPWPFPPWSPPFPLVSAVAAPARHFPLVSAIPPGATTVIGC